MEDLLTELQKKPNFQKFEAVNIILPDEKLDDDDEKIERVKINDKTKDKLINVDDFKKLISKRIQVISDTQKEDVIKESVPVKKTKRKIKLVKADEKEQLDKDNQEKQDKPIEEDAAEADDTLYVVPTNMDKRPEKEFYSMIIDDETIESRLPKKQDAVIIKKSNYYMNNRKLFIKFINTIFAPYADEIKKSSKDEKCGQKKSKQFSMLTHQKIVRDYINLYTPYRGLLLYHGLGSGKTCTSISIAEGILTTASVAMSEAITSSRKIIVMTPASLRTNYFEELKKCGNPIYRKNQYWEFIDAVDDEYVNMLSSVLHLPKTFIQKHKGAFLVNVKKEANYDSLKSDEKELLEAQLDEMIRSKFFFINYNGLRKDNIKKLTNDYSINPFSNKVVIIDEAHNFISLIVNKIEKEKKPANPTFVNTMLYKYLMEAENCRVVMLTGTPIINYPNEIGIMFNILRGQIKTYVFNISNEGNFKLDSKSVTQMFSPLLTLDYINFENNVISITRNPMNFYNNLDGDKYKGVQMKEDQPYMNEKQFIAYVVKTLAAKQIKVVRKEVKKYKALPDKLEPFVNNFINSQDGTIKNDSLFKKRVLGLTSYLDDKEQLMPKYNEHDDYYNESIEMSNYQFGLYEDVRKEERKLDKPKRKSKKAADDELFKDVASSYRTFSRIYCNFVFPEDIPRPFPNEASISEAVGQNNDEDDIDALTSEQRSQNIDGRVTLDDADEMQGSDDRKKAYNYKIKEAMKKLRDESAKYLTPSEDGLQKLSPKFLKMLTNIQNPSNEGLHLVYSQFRTLEGIGVFSLVLEANGYFQFKIKKTIDDSWVLDVKPEAFQKGKMYALYTGTESVEEKEYVRKIYNGEWDYLPASLSTDLKKMHPNNLMGEIIKVFMITASGAEGINLKNTRFVHITEPYWHPVRQDQVIGRARRICSHEDLPEHMQNVKVISYIMTFSDEQIKSASVELRNKDKSKYDPNATRPLSTDEYLKQLSDRKKTINTKLLVALRETSMDCSLYSNSDKDNNVECYSFGTKVAPSSFAFTPNMDDEEKDEKVEALNIQKEKVDYKRIKLDEVEYAMKTKNGKLTYELYDYDSYLLSKKNKGQEPRYVGKASKKNGKWVIEQVI